MRKVSQIEITAEIVDLCREKLSDLILQLNYYRASAYKKEAAATILEAISHIRAMILIISPTHGDEPFLDFAATGQNGNRAAHQGDCFFSQRVLLLVQELHSILNQAKVLDNSAHRDMVQLIQQNRHHFLALCQSGSGSWHILSTLTR